MGIFASLHCTSMTECNVPFQMWDLFWALNQLGWLAMVPMAAVTQTVLCLPSVSTWE